jgi:hypothetical protein
LRVCLLLPQVYRARVRATGQEVAVKVQRPGALSTISKDLYVMRRGVGVYEQLVRRFTAQTTDYQQLLSTFAEGLYTEMDFRNEVSFSCHCWRSAPWAVFVIGAMQRRSNANSMCRGGVSGVLVQRIMSGLSCAHSTSSSSQRVLMSLCVQALNAMKMREVLAEAPSLASDRMVIPQPLLELTTRCVVLVKL